MLPQVSTQRFEVFKRAESVAMQMLAVVQISFGHGIGSAGPVGEIVPLTASPATT